MENIQAFVPEVYDSATRELVAEVERLGGEFEMLQPELYKTLEDAVLEIMGNTMTELVADPMTRVLENGIFTERIHPRYMQLVNLRDGDEILDEINTFRRRLNLSVFGRE